MDWNETRRDFVHRLASQGTGVKVIIVKDKACTISPDSPDAFGKTTTLSKADCERGVQEL